jgi:hypothetical protein
MSEHTPGPWRFSQDGDEPYWHVDLPGPCGVRHGCGNAMVYTTEADARLIAAAPELLDALKEVADGCKYRLRKGDDNGDRHTLRLCRAAIAKAEGRGE